MATLSTTNPTLADWAKVQDPDGNVAQVIDLLSQSNEILDDMTWIEGNLPTGHRSSVRTSLPQGTWRRINQGVPGAKSTASQITDAAGMLETYSEVDKALAMLNGNSAAWRLQEDRAFLEGLNQQMAATIIYGNSSSNPERFMGLAPRYNTLSTATSQTANNVISAGGSGSDNTSIWLVVWSPNTVHGFFPKGSTAGLQSQDLGEHTLLDSNNLKYQGYRTHYKWDAGLTVRDWRYVVRICNIDVSDLSGSSAADLAKLMQRAIGRVPNPKFGRAAFYMNRTASQWYGIQTGWGIGASTSTNIRRTPQDVANNNFMTQFAGIPIRIVDQITSAEATVA